MPIVPDCAPVTSEIVALAASNIARDPVIAEGEEFNAAVLQGTVDAFDFFLARHPDGAYAARARTIRAELAARDGKQR